jgi:hypothetical protein
MGQGTFSRALQISSLMHGHYWKKRPKECVEAMTREDEESYDVDEELQKVVDKYRKEIFDRAKGTACNNSYARACASIVIGTRFFADLTT